MFGRYPLSLKRKIVGSLLVGFFVVNLYGYVGGEIWSHQHLGNHLDPYGCPWPSPMPSVYAPDQDIYGYMPDQDTCH